MLSTEMSVKLAAIGAGAWGRNIVRTLHDMGRLGVVAEAAEPLRAAMAAGYPGIAVVSNHGELFNRTEIAAVTIATPAPSHHRIAKECLLAGKDVFVEKPMTLTVGEAEDLCNTAEKLGRVLMVGHLLMYKPAIEFIRSFLAGGGLGRVYTLHQERSKLGKARAVENVLWSLGVHDVAALLFLAGEAPVRVACFGHRGLQGNVEDDTYLHMEFADGRQAHLHNSWLWPEDRRGLTIVGEKGMLVYDEKKEQVSLVRKTIDSGLNNVDGGSEILFEGSGQPLEIELQHFIDCVINRTTPRSDGRNGVDVIRVLEAAAARSF